MNSTPGIPICSLILRVASLSSKSSYRAGVAVGSSFPVRDKKENRSLLIVASKDTEHVSETSLMEPFVTIDEPRESREIIYWRDR